MRGLSPVAITGSGMDPPSSQLLDALESLGLATANQVANCRASARNLSRGLPTFDSVWVDALVKHNILTPFQAKLFDERRFEELRVNDKYVLAEQIDFDRIMPVFRALDPNSNDRALVSRLMIDPHDYDLLQRRLEHLFSKLRKLECPGHVPTEFNLQSSDHHLWVISPDFSGIPLSNLLVRRGRMPSEVVRCIGLELARQLGLHPHDLPHHDLRLSNVWLDRSGNVALLHHGVLNAVSAQLSIHRTRPRDFYDSVAPECIDRQFDSSGRADLYSLGCVLWQLLAGRPPFIIADPLAKLAAHRNQKFPDVREFVPDVDENMAVVLRHLTQANPAARPESFDVVAEALSSSKVNAPARLQRFSRSFESAAPRHVERKTSRSRGIAMRSTAMLILGGLILFGLMNQDRFGTAARTIAPKEPARLDEAPLDSTPKDEIISVAYHVEDSAGESKGNRFSLPAPDSLGVIEVSTNGEYDLASCEHSDRLVIRGRAGSRTTIHVTNELHVLVAPQVIFEHVDLRFDQSARLDVSASRLTFDSCLINGPKSGTSTPLLRWQSDQPDRPLEMLLNNVVFQSSETFLHLKSPLTAARIENFYSECESATFVFSSGVVSGFRVPMVINHSSFCGGGPIVRFETTESGVLSLQADQSVIWTKPEHSVVELVPGIHRRLANHLEFDSSGLIVQSEGILAGQRGAGDDMIEPVSTQEAMVNGVLSGRFYFELTESGSGCVYGVKTLVIEDLPIRNSASQPGFNLEQFCGAGEVP